MRWLFAILVFLCSYGSFAGCTYFAILNTETWNIDISDGDCEYQELMITFSNNSGESTQIPFNSECKELDEKAGGPGFSCEEKGRSPMAGATYKLQQRGEPYCSPDSPDGGETPGYQYVCVEGCKETVPQYLIQNHYCC